VCESQKPPTSEPVFVSFPHPQQRKQRPSFTPQKDQPERGEQKGEEKMNWNEQRDPRREGTPTGLGASAADSLSDLERGPLRLLPASAREALGASSQIRAGAAQGGSGAVEPRDVGFSRAAEWDGDWERWGAGRCPRRHRRLGAGPTLAEA